MHLLICMLSNVAYTCVLQWYFDQPSTPQPNTISVADFLLIVNFPCLSLCSVNKGSEANSRCLNVGTSRPHRKLAWRQSVSISSNQRANHTKKERVEKADGNSFNLSWIVLPDLTLESQFDQQMCLSEEACKPFRSWRGN